MQNNPNEDFPFPGPNPSFSDIPIPINPGVPISPEPIAPEPTFTPPTFNPELLNATSSQALVVPAFDEAKTDTLTDSTIDAQDNAPAPDSSAEGTADEIHEKSPETDEKKKEKEGKKDEIPDTEEEALAKKFARERVKKLNVQSAPQAEEKQSKKTMIILITVISSVIIIGGLIAFYFLVLSKPKEEVAEAPVEEIVTPIIPETKEEPDVPHYYSLLSGEEIASEEAKSDPTFCVQIPNGVDGARPQVGLHDAKVVFEAIAEAGITRFSAIYQNPPAVIGPIRSLRLYYLNWDIPFDCTVVHAGGSEEAINAVSSYGVRDLSENYSYMWRSSANYTVSRFWNNLFTSGDYLNGFNNVNGYLTSDINSFARMTPPESGRNKIDVQITNKLKIDHATKNDTETLSARVTHIDIKIGSIPNFNPVYDYDIATNTYKRSYETGAPHTSYDCSGKSGEITPELVCEEVPITASVVIAMMVQEKKASYDNYHEDISTNGAGDAYIFQNGAVIVGTWEKSSKDSQIIFRDNKNNEVKLAPGKTWISAVPESYGGSVSYE